MSRSRFLMFAAFVLVGVLGFGAALTSGTGLRAEAQTITVYKTPWCNCCTAWMKHLQRDGLEVVAIEREDLTPERKRYSVPGRLASCHTAEINGYAIEGHVPASEIRRLLKERPDAAGLSVPGMPLGSPGMEQTGQFQAYDVLLFGSSGDEAFASYVGRVPQSPSEAQ